MADQVATLIRLHKEAVAEHVLGFFLALGDLKTQPGAKLSRGAVNADVPASLAMEDAQAKGNPLEYKPPFLSSGLNQLDSGFSVACHEKPF
jgi:hypothetical protein